uniref:CCHC-type domain-containing protein n=1 Tax=Meloidogyne incognita TaxID=6306 RepID=A0A914NIF9_MELIC
MPSSRAIRSQLGPALNSLKNLLVTANQLLANYQNNQNLDQVRAARFQLNRTLDRVDSLQGKWAHFLDSLEGDDLAHEEQFYERFAPRAAGDPDYNHFMELVEKAKGVLGDLDFLIKEQSVPSGQSSQAGVSEVSENLSQVGEQLSSVTNKTERQIPHIIKQENQFPTYLIETRLPELKMDPFYGDPKKWTTFWQLFSANIDSRPMDNIRKMSYLLTFLRGPAKDLVAGFVLTNENYNRALDLLKSRYGNSRAITEALEAELMNLTPPNDSSHSLRAFVDSVERICRQLEAYGTMDQSPFVSTVIKTKLPQSIVAKLIEKERNSQVRWDSTRLRQELCNLVEISEEVRRFSQLKVRPQGGPVIPPVHQQNYYCPRTGHTEQFQSFCGQSRPIQGGQLPPPGRLCSLCNGGVHFPSECPSYSTPQARFQRFIEQRRCFRCLGGGHFARKCPSFKICAQCQENHHVLVCTRTRNDNQDFLAPDEDNYYPKKQITQMALGQNQSPVICSSKVSSVRHQVKQVQETPLVQTNIQSIQKVVVQECVPVAKVVKFTEPLPVRPKIMTLFTINKEIVKPEAGTEPDSCPQAENLLINKKVNEKDETQIQGSNCVKGNTSTVDDQITHLKDNGDFPSCGSLDLSPDLPYHKFQIEKENIITEPVDLPYHKLQIEKDNRITRFELNKPAAQEQLIHSMVSAHIERPSVDVSVQPKNQSSLSNFSVKEPVLLPGFVGLILSFRLPKFMATTDLESAFLMVGLHQTDRKFTKFQRVKDPFNLPLIEKARVSHTVVPEKLFPKQILDEKAHGTKKRLEKSIEMPYAKLAGHGFALILISLTFIINVSCDHKDQIVVCRKEQTIRRKKIPPDIPFKAFKYINQTLINKIFLTSNFIYIISIITLIISFKLKFLCTLAFFIPIILFNFLRGGEGVRDPNHNVSPDPTRIFQKICLDKLISDSPPEGDILLLNPEQSLVLFQNDERQQFGRISTPLIKTETKTLKWLGSGILPKDGPITNNPPLSVSVTLAQVPFILFSKKYFQCFLLAQHSLPPRLVARSIQPFPFVAIEPNFIKRHTLCLFPNPSRLFSVSPYPTTSFTSEIFATAKQQSTKEEAKYKQQEAYCKKLGNPVTIEDFDLSEWLDSGSDMLASTNESITSKRLKIVES